ncbi:Crp/Fnr family transcriptional regulator [Cyanobacteria bacterium FACHB-63]|nr:Crp/Fnr family transcriptional regulator [Cyanobacteria bacterium FACHB-63]
MLNPIYHRLINVLQSLTPLPDEQIGKLSEIFRPASLSAGQFFSQAGERPTQIGFVVSGLMRLYYVNSAGIEFTKAFCLENHFIAAYSALLLNQPARFFIEALEDTSLLVADYQAYQQLCAEHSCWQTVNHRLVQGLFIKKERREAELLLDDATIRYQTFLTEYPDLENRVKQYHIASYLGISPVSLSRIRKSLIAD